MQLSGPPIEVLTDEIRSAFVNALMPATLDDIGDVSENGAFELLLHEHWQDVPVEAMARLRHSSSSFCEAGFRYYAPARLMFALFDSDTAWDLLDHLGMTSRGVNFWPREKRVLLRFLEVLRAAYPWDADAERAVAEYTARHSVSAWELRREQLGLQSIAVFAWQPNAWQPSTQPVLDSGDVERVIDTMRAEAPVEWPRLLHTMLSAPRLSWIAVEALGARASALQRIYDRLTNEQRGVSDAILGFVAAAATAGR